MTNDKNRVFVYPGPTDNCVNPKFVLFRMKNEYYLDGCCNYAVNSAYLSITKEEYQYL